jgi:cell division septum initiation protein DivIVA
MGESAAEGARQEGETQISQSARSVERQAERIRKQAESEAGAVTTQAERKAAELTGEAKKVRDAAESNARLLTSGDKAGEVRVRDLVITDNEKELQETARVILSNPAGKERFDEAVGQVFAELATKSPKSAAQRWKYVSQSLRRAGLISDEAATNISKGLQDLLVTPISQAEKSGFVKSFIRNSLRNAVISYGVPGVERVISGLVTTEGIENAPD